MTRSSTGIKIVTLVVALGAPLLLAPHAFAASGDVTQVEDFIRNVIKVVAGLAGLVATGFFVVGGFGYITSSGNPEHLDRSKRTLLWSGMHNESSRLVVFLHFGKKMLKLGGVLFLRTV